MQKRAVDILDRMLERQVAKASAALDRLDSGGYDEWLTHPATQYVFSFLEATILTNTLAWQAGTLYRSSIDKDGDPEAEPRARHHIESIEYLLNVLEDFEYTKDELKRLEGLVKDESSRAQGTSEDAPDSGES